jgi:hypothetical protein
VGTASKLILPAWDKPKVAGFRAGFPDLARAG